MTIDQIFALFARFGAGQYGEHISLERHMLQTATLAQSMDAPRAVIVAALLHDIGYFLHEDGETSIQVGRNIEHEALGAAWLSRAFGEDVTAPIALHVEAKRYLCAVEPEYYARLSSASRLSLAVQGGVMSDAEAAAFVKHPFVGAAVMLRRCDDGGKDIAMRTPALEDFREILMAALRPPR